jgi:excisionase family DNA binding protein
MTTEPWASVEDVTKHLGVAKDSVYRWIDTRSLPGVRAGGVDAHDQNGRGGAR